MWKNIIGQEKVKDVLLNIYQSGKISHAYIFYGNEGTGKDAAAIEFAKLINCDNPINENEACDKCKCCIDIGSFKSPLLKYIIALPTGKGESDADSSPLEKLDKEDFLNYLDEIEAKTEDKYHNISIPKANEIRISSIRQAKRDIYLTGKTGKKKVFVISKADLMNPQSSNSLLKILEEPPKDSILILTTSRLNSLLPTIAGRGQKIKFDNISKDYMINYMRSNYPEMKESDTLFFAELSQGSITKCKEIMGKSFLELREKVLDLLSSILLNQNLKLGNEIDFIVAKKDKERVRQFLFLLGIWFRDIIHKTHETDNWILNKDKLDRLQKFYANFESNNYKIINLIEEAIRDLDSNIFPDLLLHNLSFKIRSNIRSKA